mgnify:CR=1 FL=1
MNNRINLSEQQELQYVYRHQDSDFEIIFRQWVPNDDWDKAFNISNSFVISNKQAVQLQLALNYMIDRINSGEFADDEAVVFNQEKATLSIV